MKQVIRNQPRGEIDNYKLKNVSFNNQHNLFLIFNNICSEKEMIICLNENESKELIKFVSQIEQ